GQPAIGLALHALRDMVGGELAVRGNPVRISAGRMGGAGAKHRPADPHRRLVELLLDAPGPGVARAAFDRRYLRCRYQLQEFARLLADVLYAQVAGHVVRDLAELATEVGSQ